MRDKNLCVMVGLPRSGKSTVAKEIAENEVGTIVNRDTLRLVAHGHVFRAEAEPLITFIEDVMVRSLMSTGTKNIIIDSTNLLPVFRNKWRTLAKEFGYDIKFICCQVSSDECKKRAVLSGRDDLIPIITKMSSYLSYPDSNHLTGYDLELQSN